MEKKNQKQMEKTENMIKLLNKQENDRLDMSYQNKSPSIAIQSNQNIEETVINIKYLIMSHRQLGFIYRRAKQPQDYSLGQVKILNSLTINDMIQQIKVDLNLNEGQELRIWKIGSTTVQKVWFLIRKQCRKFFKDDYLIRIPGKIQDSQKIISKLKIKQDQFLLVQRKQLDRDQWHFYQPQKGICVYCNSRNDLKVVCPCNTTKYCSLECKKKHMKVHFKECSYYIQLIKTTKQQQKKFVQNQRIKEQEQQVSEQSNQELIQTQADLNRDYDKYICKICFVNQSSRLNLQCRHLMMCRDCYANLRQISGSNLIKCPTCRIVGRYAKYIKPIYA